VTRIDGKVLFIPYCVTGDEARVEIIEEKKNYSMGRLIEILEPSPWRVKPPCPYFGVCGGCQWQHIDYSKHGELKKEILRETLRRIGDLRDVPPMAVESSSDPYHYRIRVQLKLDEGVLGYYKERSHELVDIDHCPIAHPLVNRIIPLIRESLSSFPQVKEMEINVSPLEEKGVLILHPGTIPQEMGDFLEQFLDAHPILKGLHWMGKRGHTCRGESHLNFAIPFDLTLRISAGSFSQVNLKQNERLIQWVLKFSERKGEETVLDLYAGIGNLSLPLALFSKEVWGVEENLTAVKDARFNGKKNGIKNCHFIHGKAEEALKRWSREKFGLIVLDPPRTGCKAVLDHVAGLKPKRIIYVSCDPTTLARDLRLFSEKGYPLHGLTLIDMFPQSYHMEVVGLLQRG
jgi:23S rRNA (uracil1939-C5)-methyltransferase